MNSLGNRGLLALALFLMLSSPAFAQDKIYLKTSSAPTSGLIVKVDETSVHIKLGAAGQTALRRADIREVEVAEPDAFRLGIKALDDGDDAKAVQILAPLYNKYYGLPLAWIEEMCIRYGEACVGAKNWPSAKDAFVKFRQFYPQSEFVDLAVWGEGQSCYGIGDRQGAIKLLDQFVKDKGGKNYFPPSESKALGRACVTLGRCHLDTGKSEQAVEECLKTVVLYYEDPTAVAEALYYSAQAFEKLNNAKRAQGQLEELIRDYPQSPLAADAKKKLDSLKS